MKMLGTNIFDDEAGTLGGYMDYPNVDSTFPNGVPVPQNVAEAADFRDRVVASMTALVNAAKHMGPNGQIWHNAFMLSGLGQAFYGRPWGDMVVTPIKNAWNDLLSVMGLNTGDYGGAAGTPWQPPTNITLYAVSATGEQLEFNVPAAAVPPPGWFDTHPLPYDLNPVIPAPVETQTPVIQIAANTSVHPAGTIFGFPPLYVFGAAAALFILFSMK